jgi:hypothetical protein
MIPKQLQTIFWDVNLQDFNPASFPRYTIGRILEYGDREAVAWLRENFSLAQIEEVVRTERRLTRKSANFWASIYRIPRDTVAALKPAQQPL